MVYHQDNMVVFYQEEENILMVKEHNFYLLKNLSSLQ